MCSLVACRKKNTCGDLGKYLGFVELTIAFFDSFWTVWRHSKVSGHVLKNVLNIVQTESDILTETIVSHFYFVHHNSKPGSRFDAILAQWGKFFLQVSQICSKPTMNFTSVVKPKMVKANRSENAKTYYDYLQMSTQSSTKHALSRPQCKPDSLELIQSANG